jgi:phosphate transport system permease protein
MSAPGSTFTGYQRQRKTRFGVRFGEIASRLMITIGGIGTIVAIVLVCVFLVWVAVPLFKGATTQEASRYAAPWTTGKPIRLGVDADHALAWALFRDGTLTSFSATSGEPVSQQKLFEGKTITAVSAASRADEILLGLDDGSLVLGKIQVMATLLEGSLVPGTLKHLADHASVKHEQGVARRLDANAIRTYRVKAEFDAAVKLTPPSPVVLADLTIRSNGPVLCSLTADGVLRTSEVTSRENLITGETTKELSGGEYKVAPRGSHGLPQFLAVSGVGDDVFLAWQDGTLHRIDTKNLAKPRLAEEVALTENGVKLTAIQFMIGKTTLLIGDSAGRVRAWFRTNSPTGPKMAMAHELPAKTSAVTSLGVSARSRVMAAGYADGGISLYHLTNEKHMGDVVFPNAAPVEVVMITPKEDRLVARGNDQLAAWSLDVGHPEVSFQSLVRPIWYEGYPGPAHVWQTTSGDDAFEPKYGLWPLVFGTLKATLYSLLLGVPLALAAAVYSREFLHPRVRGIVKPTIEVMASLPSVVLGFLAGLVIAPFVESVLPIIFTGFILVPLGFILAGFVWHCLSPKWTRRIQGQKTIFIALVLPCTILASIWLAPLLEWLLFGGDVRAWLRNREAPAAGGWVPLLLPLTTIVTVWVIASYINPLFRRLSRTLSHSREAFLNLAKGLLGFIAAFGLAWLLGALLAAIGIDPRDSFFGVYDQKNALVVGFMMGFAIIPIIYTLADDALASVPDHLRSASLGSGATPWQTASRIVIPTALAGIFSAVVVGLGRAVGETMIVLMAAGNTPNLDLNIFNGFRTLSATIAVEMPEAVQHSTHYRTLFLAALTLFAMTFVLNTIAEAMRQRFRRRAFEL